MTKILTTILIFFTIVAFGQSVQVNTFKLEKSKRFKAIQSVQMNFPIVYSGNKEIDSLINTDIENRFTNNEYPTENLDSTLLKWANDQIVFLDFEVTYNQNGILSLNISAEGCGANCTNWTEYFNYATTSGKWLDINAIIDTTGLFREMVIIDKNEQYKKAKLKLKESLNNPNSELTQDEYESVIEYYNECNKSFNFNRYALYSDFIEIIEECWLPRVMKPLTPIIELKYKYAEIEKFLKINY